jgi:hypothetical protein
MTGSLCLRSRVSRKRGARFLKEGREKLVQPVRDYTSLGT